MNILVTCPPMIGMISDLKYLFDESHTEVHCPDVVQTLSEDELIELVPKFDGWIIGDDPATAAVFEAGKAGRLKAAVKWGIGVDNVDLEAAKSIGIPITNTPMMFGGEVADLAMSYVVGLARETYVIHSAVTAGSWPKPRGISLAGRTMGLIGFGDIGRNVARRAQAADMRVIAYDPYYEAVDGLGGIESCVWPERLVECDFLVFTCALNSGNLRMLNEDTLKRAMPNVRIVNVARGGLIDESALIGALESDKVHSVALDVFEVEPLAADSRLRAFPRNIFGSHNGSNTSDAVKRASEQAVSILLKSLETG
jgi:D-3-phosphoglycerate dehydrogenase